MFSNCFLSSSTVLKTSPPSSHPPPVQMLCHLKLQAESFLLCACVQGGLGFPGACTGCQRTEARAYKQDISLKLHTFNFSIFLPPLRLKGNGPWERQIERDVRTRDACLFACTRSLSYKLDVTIVTCHLLMWTCCSTFDCLFLTSLK